MSNQSQASDSQDSALYFIDNQGSHAVSDVVQQQYHELLAMLSNMGAVTVSLNYIRSEPESAVYLLWCGDDEESVWRDFLKLLEEASFEDHSFYYRAIVILGGSGSLPRSAHEIMQRGAFAFACPFNVLVLNAYIHSEAMHLVRQQQIDSYAAQLAKAETLAQAVDTLLDELARPTVEYTRATVSLIDYRDDDTIEHTLEQRYLYKFRPSFPIPDRTLVKPMDGDDLMTKVLQSRKDVHIIEDIQDLRRRFRRVLSLLVDMVLELRTTRKSEQVDTAAALARLEEQLSITHRLSGITPSTRFTRESEARICNVRALTTALDTLSALLEATDQGKTCSLPFASPGQIRAELGTLLESCWEDNAATQDVNSWAGVALWAGDLCIGVITLDHEDPGHFGRFDEQLSDDIATIASLAADIIEARMRRRHSQALANIVENATNQQSSQNLIRQVLTDLMATLECDSCAYYRVTKDYSSDASQSATGDPRVLEMWVNTEGHPETTKRMWGSRDGIAGHALSERRSIIVPHALEERRFKPTAGLPGGDLSMLVVPVIRRMGGDGEDQTMGVISCYKLCKPDHFTPYDRALVEEIAEQTLSVIERTTIIESSHEIGSTINTLIPRDLLTETSPEGSKIFESICAYAVKNTGATTGVIHLFEQQDPKAPKESAGRRYTPTRSYSFPSWYDHSKPRLDGDGATDCVIAARGEVIQFCHDEAERFEKVAIGLRNEGVKYVVGVGLFVTREDGKTQVVGALFLNQFEPRKFPPMALFMMKLFAQQAALAIRNQQLFQVRDLWARGNKALSDAIAAVNRSSDPVKIYDEIVMHSGRLVEADHSYLAMVVQEGGTTLRFVAGWPDKDVNAIEIWNQTINYETDERIGIIGLAAAHKESQLIPNVADLPEEMSRQYLDLRSGTKSELAVPILEGSSRMVLGVINLESKTASHFNRDHRELIEKVAENIGIAWQKNRAIERVRSTNNEVRRLQDILEQLATISSASTDAKHLLKEVAYTVARSLPCAEAIIIVIGDSLIGPDDHEVLTETMEIFSSTTASRTLDGLDPTSRLVYSSMNDKSVQYHPWRDNDLATSPETAAGPAICLPLKGTQRCHGVLWLIFSPQFPAVAQNTTYNAIAHHTALLYELIEQHDKYRTRLASQQINLADHLYKERADIRAEVRYYSRLALAVTAGVLAFLLIGIIQVVISGIITSVGIWTVSAALLTEVVNIYVYRQLRRVQHQRETTEREFFAIRAVDVLLTSADQLERGARESTKVKIIQSMSKRVFAKVAQGGK